MGWRSSEARLEQTFLIFFFNIHSCAVYHDNDKCLTNETGLIEACYKSEQQTALIYYMSGSSCSKLTMSLVNVSLKFQTLTFQICQSFLLKKCEKLLQCKSSSHFFKKKSVCLVIKSQNT